MKKRVFQILKDYQRNDEFSIKWHIIENSSFCGGVGAFAASFFEQRLWNFGFRPS